MDTSVGTRIRDPQKNDLQRELAAERDACPQALSEQERSAAVLPAPKPPSSEEVDAPQGYSLPVKTVVPILSDGERETGASSKLSASGP